MLTIIKALIDRAGENCRESGLRPNCHYCGLSLSDIETDVCNVGNEASSLHYTHLPPITVNNNNRQPVSQTRELEDTGPAGLQSRFHKYILQ